MGRLWEQHNKMARSGPPGVFPIANPRASTPRGRAASPLRGRVLPIREFLAIERIFSIIRFISPTHRLL